MSLLSYAFLKLVERERLSRKYKESAPSYARKCTCLRERGRWREQRDDGSRGGIGWVLAVAVFFRAGLERNVHSGCIGPSLQWLCSWR